MLFLFIMLLFISLILADSFVNRRTHKGNFLNQINQLIDWPLIEKTIAQYYAPVSDVGTEGKWVRKGGQSVFGYKQHTLVDDCGLVMAMETAAATRHDSQPMLALLDKAGIEPGCRLHADKAYGSQARWFGGKILRYRGLAKTHA